jgi:hypothetical protein
MAQNGGARPGAGRKRKSDKFKGQIAKAETQIADRLLDYIDNMEQLARGIWMDEEDKDGTRRLYLRAPDRQANEYLINRIMGKPTERKEITSLEKPLHEMTTDELRSILES